MKPDRRSVVSLALVVGAGSALLVASLMIRTHESPKQEAKRTLKSAKQPERREHGDPGLAAIPRSNPAPGPVIVAATEQARVAASYQNYRTAVATDNEPMRKALARTLKKDMEQLKELAQREAAAARTDRDRQIALRTLESLTR